MNTTAAERERNLRRLYLKPRQDGHNSRRLLRASGPLPDAYATPDDVFAYQRDMAELAGLLNSSDDGYPPGDRLGVELSRQAAYQVVLTDNTELAPIPGYALPETTITNLLDVGTRNPEANHALITGLGDEQLLGADYHRDTVIVPLLTHEWEDEGATLSNMFSWINPDTESGAAPFDRGNPEDPRAVRAGEAAFGLAQLLSSTQSETTGQNLYSTWLDMPNADGQSLGQVNPVATQALAGALTRYTGSMVGMSDALTYATGFGRLGGPIEAVRVFSVLNGDAEAGQVITSAAFTESMRLDGLFAANESLGIDSSFLGCSASNLHWLATTGLDMEISERQSDQNIAAAEHSQRLNAAYTGAEIIVGGPGPGPAMLAAAAELARPDALSPDPSMAGPLPLPDGAQGPAGSTQFGTPPARMYEMVETLQRQGLINLSDLPEEFRSGDSMRPYEDLLGDRRPSDQSTLAGAGALQMLPSILEAHGIDPQHAASYTTYAAGQLDHKLDSVVYPQNHSGPDALGILTTDLYSSSTANVWPTGDFSG
ncbi:TPR repeat region-containing protein [Millisia brevis]|uniref:TPR repeat region-containing protein n=1 Tax=Millisia brevis TaxID=264148 RepID=UPI0012EE7F0F|nr:hypothetical protein [Millisia brevis]